MCDSRKSVQECIEKVNVYKRGLYCCCVNQDGERMDVNVLGNDVQNVNVLTDKYYADKANDEIKVAEEVADSAGSVMEIIDSIYDSRAMQPENARSNNVELQVDENKLAMPEFKALWGKINSKSVYVVDFDTDELVRKAIASLDTKLRVSKIYVNVKIGELDRIDSKYL